MPSRGRFRDVHPAAANGDRAIPVHPTASAACLRDRVRLVYNRRQMAGRTSLRHPVEETTHEPIRGGADQARLLIAETMPQHNAASDAQRVSTGRVSPARAGWVLVVHGTHLNARPKRYDPHSPAPGSARRGIPHPSSIPPSSRRAGFRMAQARGLLPAHEAARQDTAIRRRGCVGQAIRFHDGGIMTARRGSDAPLFSCTQSCRATGTTHPIYFNLKEIPCLLQ